MPATATTGRGRPRSSVDPTKWATLLDEILANRPDAPMPASEQTVRKWRKGQSGVTADMVRDVCRALGWPVARALVEVGWLTPDELGVAGFVPLKPPPEPRLHPLAKRINTMLTDPRFGSVYDFAVATFEGAYQLIVRTRRSQPRRESIIEPRRET